MPHRPRLRLLLTGAVAAVALSGGSAVLLAPAASSATGCAPRTVAGGVLCDARVISKVRGTTVTTDVAPTTDPAPSDSPAPTATTEPTPSATTSPTGTATSSPTPSPTSSPAPVVAPTSSPAPSTPSNLGAVAFNGKVDQYTHVDAYRYLQLNAWEADKARALKAANPGLKVLVYKDMSSSRSYAVTNGVDDRWLPTGVGYAWADRNRPDFFLKDTTGARMEWPWSGHWWMDVGNADYQRAWLANVSAELADGPWDGVIIDNVMASPEWYLSGRTIAKYPTRSQYEAATESFLKAVGPALRSSTGKLVMGNISDAWPTTWDRWVGYLSGANHEHSWSWNNGTLYGGADWLSRIEEMERTQRAGRIFTATSEAGSTETAKLTYLRASFLLAWDGGATGSAQMVHLKDKVDPWSSVTATDLGTPTGPRTAVGAAWLRTYTKGAAVVNPSGGTVTVPLPSGLLLGGRSVSSVTLAPLSGALLTR